MTRRREKTGGRSETLLNALTVDQLRTAQRWLKIPTPQKKDRPSLEAALISGASAERLQQALYKVEALTPQNHFVFFPASATQLSQTLAKLCKESKKARFGLGGRFAAINAQLDQTFLTYEYELTGASSCISIKNGTAS